MKCVEFPLKESKAEPRINEWLENNSNLNIKFINQAVVNGIRRVTYYYELRLIFNFFLLIIWNFYIKIL